LLRLNTGALLYCWISDHPRALFIRFLSGLGSPHPARTSPVNQRVLRAMASPSCRCSSRSRLSASAGAVNPGTTHYASTARWVFRPNFASPAFQSAILNLRPLVIRGKSPIRFVAGRPRGRMQWPPTSTKSLLPSSPPPPLQPKRSPRASR